MRAESHGKKGQSLVELALLMPFLLWILVGVIDFGRVYYFDNVAINAARAGARVGSDFSTTTTAICNATKADAAGSRMTLTTCGTSNSGDDIYINYTANGPSHTPPLRGDDITVTVRYRFSPITPLIGSAIGNTLTVTRSATMRVIY